MKGVFNVILKSRLFPLILSKAVFSVVLLSTLFGWQLLLFGQEPQCQHQDKTFQQYLEDSSDKDPQVRQQAEDALNVMYSAAELQTLQESINRGRPFGTESWQRSTANRLGLESSLRSRGRPRKVVKK